MQQWRDTPDHEAREGRIEASSLRSSPHQGASNDPASLDDCPIPQRRHFTLSLPDRQWRAAISLGWPLAMGAVPVLASLDSLPLCAFRQISGQPCPLCGGTHACAALLSGDVSAAWQANPGLLAVLLVAAAHSIVLAREALAGRRMGPARCLAWAWAGAGAILLGAWSLRLLGQL